MGSGRLLTTIAAVGAGVGVGAVVAALVIAAVGVGRGEGEEGDAAGVDEVERLLYSSPLAPTCMFPLLFTVTAAAAAAAATVSPSPLLPSLLPLLLLDMSSRTDRGKAATAASEPAYKPDAGADADANAADATDADGAPDVEEAEKSRESAGSYCTDDKRFAKRDMERVRAFRCDAVVDNAKDGDDDDDDDDNDDDDDDGRSEGGGGGLEATGDGEADDKEDKEEEQC